MKTLLERAKPQLLVAMAKQKEKYPAIAEENEKHLTKNFFITDLNWGTWMDLRIAYRECWNQSIETPYEIFE